MLNKHYKLLIILLSIGINSAFAQSGDEPAERAALGINIATRDTPSGPVEGVVIVGITPGGAAENAGLRPNDVLITIEDVALTAGSVREANARLFQFMRGAEPGQELRVAYLRGGKVLETRLVADAFDPSMAQRRFPFQEDLERLGRRFENEFIAPLQTGWRHYGLFAGMELAALTPELGRYFGTEEGLLVVRAPTDETIGLEDGDVIQRIGARVPNDPAHAMRILRSYEPGEELVIAIMREQRSLELRITLPEAEARTGRRFERWLRIPGFS